ncbi:PREDICTED: uncharacterized protein LOC109219977 [Nicotiana attenuata]|uniref:uncharacterized protein LOC109219977 n=1 Tax=Nicotiana attenuata TaxID=49451 RepID=UPI000904E160|nr:PREDICTED: uncharacterized protein LOC109219977 [Nicotiana attenuata]
MGYVSVRGFYVFNSRSEKFVLIENDEKLYNIGCQCKEGVLDLFVCQLIDDPLVEVVPIALICGPQVVENESRATLDVNTTTENTQAENLGSSGWIRTDSDTTPGKHLFVYFYVCFDALKRGWLEGCRRIIGFDGCFLKGLCKGELLVVVGKNGNNQMFPIAWAVVDQETKHSWTWFIQYLAVDLELGDETNLIVMLDSQKGLVPAIEDCLPMAEHRMCARHIWSNWAKKWKGEERRMQFWRCSKSSFVVQFKDELARLSMLGRNICEDALDYNKEVWVRAYFSDMSKCDVVENNMYETFNSWIVGPRHKSIISILEEIGCKIMTRHVDMRRFAVAAIGGRGTSNISSNIQQAHETQQAAGYKRPRQSGFGIYQDTMTERSILNHGA